MISIRTRLITSSLLLIMNSRHRHRYLYFRLVVGLGSWRGGSKDGPLAHTDMWLIFRWPATVCLGKWLKITAPLTYFPQVKAPFRTRNGRQIWRSTVSGLPDVRHFRKSDCEAVISGPNDNLVTEHRSLQHNKSDISNRRCDWPPVGQSDACSSYFNILY